MNNRDLELEANQIRSSAITAVGACGCVFAPQTAGHMLYGDLNVHYDSKLRTHVDMISIVVLAAILSIKHDQPVRQSSQYATSAIRILKALIVSTES
jgi:hypothetical protein